MIEMLIFKEAIEKLLAQEYMNDYKENKWKN